MSEIFEVLEINPMAQLEEILSQIEQYHPQVNRIVKDKVSYIDIKIVNDAGEELFIELFKEFSIFFGDWHTHYFADALDYAEFLDDLSGILESRKYTVCEYRNDQWCGSTLMEGETPDESALKKECKKGITIKCSYFDHTKNRIFSDK